MTQFEPPIHWSDYEDIARKLYARFGEEFNEGNLAMIRSAQVYEWRTTISKMIGKSIILKGDIRL